MRITAGRRVLLQFLLDNKAHRVSLGEIHAYLEGHGPRVDRASVYRNLETFKALGIIQELKLPRLGRCFQYALDRKVQHFYICRACGRAKHGDERIFDRIEAALSAIPGFSAAELSAVFYGTCARCAAQVGTHRKAAG